MLTPAAAAALVAIDSILPENYTRNIKLSNTAKFRAAVRDPSRNAWLNFPGDSTIAGQTTGGGTSQALNSLPARLAAELEAAGIPASANSMFGLRGSWGQSASIANTASGDGRILAYSGTIPTGGFAGLGGHPFIMASAASFELYIQPHTDLELVWNSRTSGGANGVFSYSLDGAPAVNVNTNTGTEACARQKIVSGQPLAARRMVISWVSGSCPFVGYIAYDNTGARREIVVMNEGISGAGSATVFSDTGHAYSARNWLKALNPDLTLGQCGLINDWRQSIALATSKSTIKAGMEDALISGDAIMVVPVFDGGNIGNTGQQEAYVRNAYDISDELDIPLIDIRPVWKSYRNALQLGYMSDSVHPKALGYFNQARPMARVLAHIARMQ